jgi:hypothetical protein
MLVVAILGTIGAVVWTILGVFANGMSDAPSAGFQGGWTIVVAWVVAAVIWLAWWFR